MSAAPRRILHIFSTFDPGGPQLRQARLIGQLPASWSHEILAMDGRTGARAHLPADRECTFVDAPTPHGVLGLRKLGRFLAARPADLRITYNWGAFDMLAAARLRGLAPLLHVVDGFRPDEADHEIFRRRMARRLLYPRVDAVVVISEQLRRMAKTSWHVPTEKLHYIPNGVDLARFAHGDRAQAHARWDLPEAAVILGAVGGLRAVKDHPTLLRAFALLESEPILVIAGDGPLQSALHELAEELGVADRIRFLGHVEDTSELYPALDLLVFSSQSEQMPITALEAMASSLPIVGTQVGDLAHMLPSAATGLLAPPREPKALAACIQPLLASPEARERAGHANLMRCRESYSEETMIASWEELLSQLLLDPDDRGIIRAE